MGGGSFVLFWTLFMFWLNRVKGYGYIWSLLAVVPNVPRKTPKRKQLLDS